MPTASSPWFVVGAPRARPRARLFCIPFAGGAASAFRQWSSELSQEIEVVSVQLPGREHRLQERPLERIDDMVRALSREIRPWLDGTPLALYGHSMGGLVAFELARSLAGTCPVEHLFVSGCRAPRLPRGVELHHLPHREFVAELRALGGTPEDVLRDEELMGLFVPLLRADLTANETYGYRPAPPLACPITAFGGLGDHIARRADLEGWKLETAGSFSLNMLPGDHFFIGPRRTELTHAIEAALAPRGASPRSYPQVVWHGGGVTSGERAEMQGQEPATVWLTGLSGSGKSTIAFELERRLMRMGHAAYVLDGDNMRHGLTRDLGFSANDRKENIRRVAEVAKLFNDAGLFVIAAFISPYQEDRDAARTIIGTERFIETYLSTGLEVCERRDPKGLYVKARAGRIPGFTGVSAPYERPLAPQATLDTAVSTLDECVGTLLSMLSKRFRRETGARRPPHRDAGRAVHCEPALAGVAGEVPR